MLSALFNVLLVGVTASFAFWQLVNFMSVKNPTASFIIS